MGNHAIQDASGLSFISSNHQLPFFQNWRKTTCVLCRSGNVWHSWVRESGILGRLATKTGEQ